MDAIDDVFLEVMYQCCVRQGGRQDNSEEQSIEQLVPPGFCSDLIELASRNKAFRSGVPLEDPSLLSASSLFETSPPEVEESDSDSDDLGPPPRDPTALTTQ